MPLCVVDTSDEQIPEGIWINEELVRLGLAKLTVIFSSQEEGMFPLALESLKYRFYSHGKAMTFDNFVKKEEK